MEKLYFPLKTTKKGRTRMRSLRSVWASVSLLGCMLLFFGNVTGQVSSPLISAPNGGKDVQSSNPDAVPSHYYNYSLLGNGDGSNTSRTAGSSVTPNPDLPVGISCPNLKVIFVLDESGSLKADADKARVRASAIALAQALEGSGAELRVIEFATYATVVNLGATTVNSTFMTNFNNYLYSSYSGQSYNPISVSPCTGWTHWEDALIKVNNTEGALVIFFTDGNPTAYNVSSSSTCTGPNNQYITAGSSSSVVTQALDKARIAANAVKASGKHMFVLGLQGENGFTVDNMKHISGNDDFATNPSIYTADYALASNVDALADNLTAAVNVICGTTLSITKTPSAGPFCVNEFVTYTITVKNVGTPNGYPANNVVLTDVFPSTSYSNVQIVGSAPSGASVSGNTLTYNIGTLTNNQSKTIQVKAKITSIASLLNTAKATAFNANQVTASAFPQMKTIPPTFSYCPPTTTIELGSKCTANTNPDYTGGYAKGKDNCGNGVTFTYSDDVQNGCGSSKTITRTWTATDLEGNTNTCTQIINVVDNTNPTITAPANVTVKCTSNVPAPNANNLTASDNCSDVTKTFVSDEVQDSVCVNNYKIKRKYKATDACGNVAYAIQTITVKDDVAPTLTAPSNFSANCSSPLPEPNIAGVTATDNCGGSVTVEFVSDTPTGTSGCNYTIKRKFKGTDACGNFGFATQTITVTDNTNPTASNPTDWTANSCNASYPAPNTSVVTDAADNCSTPTVTWMSDSKPVVNGCTETMVRKYKVSDACGNSIIVSQNLIRTVDTQKPTVEALPDIILPSCNGTFPVADIAVVNASDNCGTPTVTYVGDSTPSVSGCTETTVRTYKVTDACTNFITVSQNLIRTVDTQKPTASTPSDIIVPGCNGPFPAPDINVITDAADNCGTPTVTWVKDNEPTMDGCTQVMQREYKVTDSCGNSIPVYQNLRIVLDNEDPTASTPNDIILPGCNKPFPAPDVNVITDAADNCGTPTVTWVKDFEPSMDGCTQVMLRKYKVTDSCYNSINVYQYLRRTVDNEAPVFTYVPEVTAANCSDEEIDFGTPLVSDNCSTVTLTYTDTFGGNGGEDCGQYKTYSKGGYGSPSNSTPGAYRDANFDGAFPTGLTIGCSNASYSFTSASAVKNFLPATGGPAVLPSGTHITNPTGVGNNLAAQLLAAELNVGFDAYDPDFGEASGFIGNLVFASGTFQDMTVTNVMQIANDVLGGCSTAYTPAQLNVAMEDVNLSFHEGTTNSGKLVCVDSGNSCSYTVTRTWTAKDACGNTATAEQVVTVADTTNPTIDAPADYSLPGCNPEWPETVSATWTDNCSEGGIITGVAGDVVPNGCYQTREYIFQVEDDCGNPAETITRITRKYDVTKPVITTQGNQILENCNQEWPETVTATWTDNCSEGGELVGVPGDVDTNGCTQTRVYTFTVTDSCGNSETASVVYTRTYDVTNPVVVNPIEDKFYQCDDEVVFEEPEFEDNCGIKSVVRTSEEVETLERGYIIHVVYTATDYCGNTAEESYDIIVVDEEDPILVNIPENIYTDCGDIPEAQVVTGTDNCGGELEVEFDETVTEDGCYKHIERTWTVTDPQGNVTTHTQIIEINDTIAPTVIVPADTVLTLCNQDWPELTGEWTDNCSAGGEIIGTPGPIETNGCTQVRTYYFSATDDCGNTAVDSMAVTRTYDVTKPVINAPADYVLDGCNPDWPEVVAADWSDNCAEGGVIYGQAGEVSEDECTQSRTYFFSVTDDCSNSETAQTTITRAFNEVNPVIEPIANFQLDGCNKDWPTLTTTWTSTCSNGGNVTGVPGDVVTDGCIQTREYSFTVSDDCGLGATIYTTVSRVYNVTAPVIHTQGNQILELCNQDWPEEVTAYWTSDCSQGGELVGMPGDVVTDGCTQTREYTFAVTDSCGNSETASVVYTRTYDVTKPVINAPADYMLDGCNPDWPEVVAADWSDNCAEGGVIYGQAGEVSADECTQSRTYFFSVTDDCGNLQTAQTTITRAFNEVNPVIEPIANFQLDGCNKDWPTLTTTWSSSCSGGGDVTGVQGDVVSDGCMQYLTYTFTVNDDCGLGATATTTVSRIYDVTDPTIYTQGDYTLPGCNPEWPAEVAATWTDNCSEGGTIYGVAGEVEGEDCLQSRVYTFAVTDDCGNNATASITISRVYDVTEPTIIAPANYMLPGCNPEWPTEVAATWTDNCSAGGTIYGQYEDLVEDECTQARIYYFSVSDDCGNSRSASTIITRAFNEVNPVIEPIANFQLDGCNKDWPTLTTTWSSSCSGGGTVTGVQGDVVSDGCMQYLTYTFTVNDDCGLGATATTTVSRIYDVTAPVISVPTVELEGCNPEWPNAEAVVASWVDNCSEGGIIYGVAGDVITEGCSQSRVYTFAVTDDCGNNATASITITRTFDETAPVISGEPTVEMPCDNYEGVIDASIGATDNCGVSELFILGDVAVEGETCSGSIIRTYRAIDNCGNSSDFDQLIVLTDNVSPVANVIPQDFTVECGTSWEPTEVSFTDNCDSNLSVLPDYFLESDGCTDIHHFTWIAIDCSGNATTLTQNITVIDTTAPVFEGAAEDQTFSCDEMYEAPADPSVSDNCDEEIQAIRTATIVEGECANSYDVVYTWTAIDACGNESSVSVTYHIVDETAPVLSNTPEEAELSVECGQVPAASEVTAYDSCSGEVEVVFEEVTSGDCDLTITRTWTATDACGNASSFTQVITVIDNVAPEMFGCPEEDLVLGCFDQAPAPAEVTAIDNCGGEIEVSFEEFFFGDEPTEGAVADCRIVTPVRPANNPCGYPVDWGMAMFGMPNEHRFYQVDQGHLARFADGSMHVTATMRNITKVGSAWVLADRGWEVDVWFANEKDWAAYSSQSFPTAFKSDCGGNAANHEDWLYFLLQAGSGAELTGFGGYEGSSLNLVHAPANKYFGFQLGAGANNYNATENGFGGWFTYSGSFIVNEEPFSGNGIVSGAGDFAFELECCPNYYIIRQWTATDCSGNTSVCSQTITFDGDDNIFTANNDMITNTSSINDDKLVVSVSPNPANNNTLFTFRAIENANTTLEVFDAIGQKVADVFMGSVEAGIEYKVNYNVNSLATGIYLYRLQNGNAEEVGKLIIGK